MTLPSGETDRTQSVVARRESETLTRTVGVAGGGEGEGALPLRVLLLFV